VLPEQPGGEYLVPRVDGITGPGAGIIPCHQYGGSQKIFLDGSRDHGELGEEIISVVIALSDHLPTSRGSGRLPT
jgi:hypothetical protein